MSEHEAAEVTEADGVVTVTCACGEQFHGQREWKAEAAHAAHKGIHDARAALRGEQETTD